jgi:hypothetical protein
MLTQMPKCAKAVVKSIARRRTSTGHAVFTSLSGAVRCGGAVEREARSNLDANLVNI